ncbi:hypothetical protein CMK11_11130 [Candidatus Poribacteria bacterium]|nr:hypothetical protein [Candidatus Poribacteria bacterium]
MGIFVNHVHVFPEWLRPDGTIDQFRAVMDACGIDRASLWAPFSHRWAQGAAADQEPGAHNRWLAREVQHHPEFVGFGTVDPAEGAPLAAEQVREIAELGLRGIKLHPAAQRFRIDSPWVIQVCRAAANHRLLVDWHTGTHQHSLADSHPLLLDRVAEAVPDVTMVFEHVGGWSFYRDVVAVIQNHPPGASDGAAPGRLYAGITSVLDRNRREWYLGAAGLDELRWQLGEALLIYGTDFPYNRTEQITADIELIQGLSWPEEAKAAVLGGNLVRLLSTLR